MFTTSHSSLTRRHLLKAAGTGFGYLAFVDLLARAAEPARRDNPLSAKAGHHPAKAKRVIFLFMHGGPSQVDTFDYKPTLDKMDGRELPFEPAKGTTVSRKIMKPLWKFQKYGESGIMVSDLFTETAKHIDDLCIINSMHTEGQSHGQAVLKLHTGDIALTRPSVGSWITYGLGTENQNLPGFITICPTRGHGGAQNYGNAFLPALYQGTPIGAAGIPASSAQIKHIHNPELTPELQRQQLDFMQQLNQQYASRTGTDDRLDAAVESYELAFRMQSAVPKVADIRSETKDTLKLYGIGEKPTDDFGRQCLMARRFAEAGVRYIQVSHSFKWDQHGNMKQHETNAKEVDRPIAGLLTDLKQRGLLKDTLVLWGGEFGRTPVTQGKDGRDHNPQGFTMWLAGGGIKGGRVHGSTDEFGYHAVTQKVHMHDLHATILWLLGLDHEKLTYRYAGRDFRLTDVYGNVVKELFA
ncbi:MAG TPA: DUF1501 domain-containing protein [Gemmata sp.]|nr:DUF1501 domain-containing protein [Gemmata sp.]